MNTTYSVSAASTTVVPTAHIATHNNRQKQYNPTSVEPIYYLNSNDEFQIELYNPTQYVVRCDIWLNGSIIPGGGLVLRPAERVFLDRYLNSPRKFIFETYKVGNTANDKEAIAKNGSVQVKFYKEIQKNSYTIITNSTGNTYIPYVPLTTTNPPFVYTTNTGGISRDFFDATSLNISHTGTISTSGLLTDSPDPIRTPKKVETGRVGEGSNSNQKFTNVHYEFEYSPFHIVSYKLLPHSAKPHTVNTLNKVRYCTDCGSKIKKGWKFCSKCGAKI